jgi:hypothetical protein
MVFIKAKEGPPNVKKKETDPDIFTVQYFDEQGNMTIRSDGVHKKRGVIYEYCVQKNGQDIWLPKSEAISMAASQQLHAIVVHMKNGSCYLRPEYHAPPFSSLIV